MALPCATSAACPLFSHLEVNRRLGMARFIVIERGTGRVYGDTARYGSAEKVMSPADAVCLIDRRVGRAARGFGYTSAGSTEAQYDVYKIRPLETDYVTTRNDEAQAIARERGSLVASLISYNS
jgi:hypothetical protein